MMKSMAKNLLIAHRSGSRILIQSARRMTSSPAENEPAELPLEDQVLFEQVGNKGMITLNRPKVLNSLNLSMVKQIHPVLKEWETSKDCVIIRGSGDKAFCAGGDVKSLALALRETDGAQLGRDFFRAEYTLNYLIGTYKKPYIALMNGITMGGGVGLSVHGKYRIATEKSLFAMPETTIGLFPDVGGTYFLPKLQGKLGLYLGLTGHRLKGADLMHTGIATHYIPSENLELVIEDLMKSTDTDVDKFLDGFKNVTEEFTLESNIEKINYHFSKSSLMEIINSLRDENSEWSNGVLARLKLMSPTSLALTFEALRRASKLSLAECLIMEYRLSYSCLRRQSDFYEGVRALLIDKDQKPMWNPRNIGDVSETYVEKHFSPLPNGEELQLVGPSHL